MNQMIKNYKGHVLLIIISYLCIISFGIIETLKGTVIPSIRAEFLVDYTQIGQMLFIASLGYLISAFFGGIVAEKYGLKKLLVFGSSFIILSTGLFSVMYNFYGVVATYFILGIGLGCFEVGVNALGAKIFTENAAMMMNLMHLFFGVGAIIAPKYAGIFIKNNYSWKTAYLMTIILIFILLLMIVFTRFPEDKAEEIEKRIPLKEIIKERRVWFIAISLGVFSVMESGIINWLVTYLQEVRGFDVVKSTSYLTLFFITFTFGRLVGGYIADKIGYIKTLLYFTTIATLMIFGGVILGETFAILFSLVGFFVSIIFPTMMVIIMKEYTRGVSSVMGLTITTCGIFTMLGNGFIGKINDLWGVNMGMGSLGICGVIVSLLLFILNKQK